MARHHDREHPYRQLHRQKRREIALHNAEIQISFYKRIISPFEKQPHLGVATITTASTGTSTKCHLMELPAELRLRIYSYILTRRETIYLSQRNYATSRQPSLLRVSRQMRREALPVYFSSNFFTVRLHLSHFEDLSTWLELVVSKCRSKQAFHSIRFEIQSGGWEDACRGIAFFNLLRVRKLVLGSFESLFVNRADFRGHNRLPRALTKVAAQARGMRSYGMLISNMEKMFEEYIRKCNFGLAGKRLGRFREQCKELRRRMSILPRDR